MKRLTILQYLSVFLIFTLGLTSCNIKEDMSNCPGEILLDYSNYSQVILDEIDPSSVVKIFIFDTDSICFDILSCSYAEVLACGGSFSVPITYNGLPAVVWHGVTSTDFDIDGMALNAHINDFEISLNHDEDNEFGHEIIDLWGSPLENIEFCASKTRHRIHMTKIDTDIDVSIQQANGEGAYNSVDMRDYIVTIEVETVNYNIDYTCCCDTEIVYFSDEDLIRSTDVLTVAELSTLRLTPDMMCYLYVAKAENPDEKIQINGLDYIDLVDYMLSSDASSAEDEQLFLDLNKKWEIELYIEADEVHGYVAVSLMINGWRVWFSDVGLH